MPDVILNLLPVREEEKAAPKSTDSAVTMGAAAS